MYQFSQFPKGDAIDPAITSLVQKDSSLLDGMQATSHDIDYLNTLLEQLFINNLVVGNKITLGNMGFDKMVLDNQSDSLQHAWAQWYRDGTDDVPNDDSVHFDSPMIDQFENTEDYEDCDDAEEDVEMVDKDVEMTDYHYQFGDV